MSTQKTGTWSEKPRMPHELGPDFEVWLHQGGGVWDWCRVIDVQPLPEDYRVHGIELDADGLPHPAVGPDNLIRLTVIWNGEESPLLLARDHDLISRLMPEAGR